MHLIKKYLEIQSHQEKDDEFLNKGYVKAVLSSEEGDCVHYIETLIKITSIKMDHQGEEIRIISSESTTAFPSCSLIELEFLSTNELEAESQRKWSLRSDLLTAELGYLRKSYSYIEGEATYVLTVNKINLATKDFILI